MASVGVEELGGVKTSPVEMVDIVDVHGSRKARKCRGVEGSNFMF